MHDFKKRQKRIAKIWMVISILVAVSMVLLSVAPSLQF